MQGEAGGLDHHQDKTTGKLAGSSKQRSAPCSRPRVPPTHTHRGLLRQAGPELLGQPTVKETPATPSSTQAAPCSAPGVRCWKVGGALWCLQDVSGPLGPTPAPSCPLTKGRSAPGQAERRRRPASVPGPPQDRQQKQSAAHARRGCSGSCRSAGEVHRAAPRGRVPTTERSGGPGGSAALGLVLAEGTGDPLQGHPRGLGCWGAFTGPRLCI